MSSAMELTVCSLAELEARSGSASGMLSLLDPEWPKLHIAVVAPLHLTLRFHDILEAAPGLVPPALEHANAIIGFVDALAEAGDGRRHLLIHCHAGLSRSPAAMVLALARLQPLRDEAELFARLRQLRPDAWPNSLLVRLGDEALGRGGGLLEALRDHYGHQVRRQPKFIRWMTQMKRVAELEMAR